MTKCWWIFYEATKYYIMQRMVWVRNCALIFSIQSGEKRIKSNELDIKLFKAQVQEEVDSTKARATKISKMAQQVKALLNQLKDIRSAKRKMLQEIWGFDSETRFYLKEKRAKNKSRAKWNEGYG